MSEVEPPPEAFIAEGGVEHRLVDRQFGGGLIDATFGTVDCSATRGPTCPRRSTTG
jgi:hypothetical protein